MSRLQLIVVAFTLSLLACSSVPVPKDPNAMPAWVANSGMGGGTLSAIGVAGRTYDQSISSQRKLAIKRALDELSMQMGVRVELNMTKVETVSDAKAHLSTQDKSSYSANNKVTAHIKEVWMDRTSKELYILMVLDK